MKIYRVAETKRKSKEAYEEVDSIDLSNYLNSWKLEKNVEEISISIEEINISKKDANEKLSLIKIVFTEKDIIALNQRLVEGLQEKLSDYKNLKAENEKLKKDIWNLWKAKSAAGEVLRIAKKNSQSKTEIDRLETIISVIDSFKQN